MHIDECRKIFKFATARSAHLGKGPRSRSDDDKPARVLDTDNPKKQNRTKQETPLSRKVHYQYDESSAVDSEILSDDESSVTTSDEFDPNSS